MTAATIRRFTIAPPRILRVGAGRSHGRTRGDREPMTHGRGTEGMAESAERAASGRVRLLAVDLDGTLLDDRDAVSAANRRAIRKAVAAGAIPVIASGRMREEAQFVLDALPEIRYFIGMNGGLVEDLKTGAVLQNRPLESRLAHRLIDRLDEAGFFIQTYGRGRVFCTRKWMNRLRDSGMSERYLDMFAGSIREWAPNGVSSAGVYKLLAVAPTPERAAELRRIACVLGGLEIFHSLPALGYHEIVPAGTDKSQALKLLCSHLAIPGEDVLAIGDSQNDLGMFRFAGKTAAVENAASVLRRAAGYVASANHRDGVADAIRHYLFPGDGNGRRMR